MSAHQTPVESALAGLRVEYQDSTSDLDVGDTAKGWAVLLGEWLAEAQEAGLPDSNAMVLATVDASGQPHSRTVLCKGLSEEGVDFYTHYASVKGEQLAQRPHASVTFPWYGLSRQVHLRGAAHKLEHEFSNGYWSHRPRGNQIGAWASEQSRPIDSRQALQAQLREADERFPEHEPVPLPAGWGGYRLVPTQVEFWQGRASRLHNRILLTLAEGQWQAVRLQP